MSQDFGHGLNTENSNVLELIVSLHSGQRDCLREGPRRSILKRDNWKKLNEGTINKGVGRMKRNGQAW